MVVSLVITQKRGNKMSWDLKVRDLEYFLDTVVYGSWNISEKGVRVQGSVCLENMNLEYIPCNFEYVEYEFDCSNNKLKSLEGAPKECYNFHCSNNKLTNLEDGPLFVVNEYDCSFNNLTSLKGLPIYCKIFNCSNNQLTNLKEIQYRRYQELWCGWNQITSLEDAEATIYEEFNCDNNQITSLKSKLTLFGSISCRLNRLTNLVGLPEYLYGSLDCSQNKITSLEGAPKKIFSLFVCANNLLTNLQHAPDLIEIGDFDCRYNYLPDDCVAHTIIKNGYFLNEEQKKAE